MKKRNKDPGTTRQTKELEDLSKQLQTQKAVYRELLTFRQIIHSSPNPILITNNKITIEYVNPAWELLTGYSFDEVYGKNPRFLQSGKTPPEVYKKLYETLSTDKAFISNRIIDKRKNGSQYILHSAIFPIHLAFKKRYYVQVSHDITYQKTVEEAKDILNKRIASILDSISDGFISLDTHWRFTYINKQAEKILPKKRESVMGKNMWKVYPELVNTDLYNKYHQAIKQQEVIKFKTQEISDKWFDVHVYPSSAGLSIYFNNITLEQEIEQRKDEFISVASHELKTPITSLSLYTQLLKRSLEQNKLQDALAFAQKIDERMSALKELTTNLLDTKAIQSGKLQLKKKTFAIDTLIKEIVEKCQDTTVTHNIVILEKAKIKVHADKSRIGEVIENLITNAIKYSPKANSIIVKAFKGNTNIIVSVQDFGIGIAKNKQSQIFSRFYRIVGKNGETFSGLGLGLYVSANIIKQHGGQMWVESSEGKGSTFYFSLAI